MIRSAKFISRLGLLAAVAASLAGCSKAARQARHLERADKYFADNQYPQAEIEYLNVAKDNQADAHAISQLGTIYAEEGRYARALPYLARGLELNPTNQQLRLRLGKIQLLAGNIKEARSLASAVLEKDPGNAEAVVFLAEATRREEDIVETQQRFQALLTQTRDSAALQTGAGTLAVRQGNLKEAEADFKKAIDLDPKFAPAHNLLGKLYWVQNDLANADQELQLGFDLSPPRSDRRLDYANFKIKTGRVQEAQQLLTQATKECPDYLLAWIGLADLALAQKQFVECDKYLQQALTRDPDNHDTLLLDGQLKIAKGEIDPAITQLERITGLYPRSARAHYFLALAYLTKGDNSKGLKQLDEAIASDPTLDDALLLQAELNLRRNNPDGAILALRNLTNRRPYLAKAHLLLANAFTAKGDLDNALAVGRQLETLFPKSPQMPYLTGNTLDQLGKHSDARAAYSHALELDPNFLPAVERLVTQDLAEQHFDAANDRVRAQLEKNPRAAELHTMLGRIALARKDNSQAEQSFKTALDGNPNYNPAALALAQLYINTHQNAQALEQLNALIAHTPTDVQALMLIGMLHGMEKNYEAERDAYEKLLAVDPNFGPALNNLAYVYSEKLNQLDKAYEIARHARELRPYDPSTADTLGWILVQRNELSRALVMLQESADKLPGEAEIAFHLGMACYLSAEEDRARVALSHALELKKEFSRQPEAVAALAVLNVNPAAPGPNDVALLEKRLQSQPDDPIALYRLGDIYLSQGASDKAAQVFERSLKANPKNIRAAAALARLYTEAKNHTRALEVARDAYKVEPDNLDLAYTLGRVAFDNGDGKWAVTLLLQATQKKPATADSFYRLALAQYSIGRINEAGASLRAAFQINTNFARVSDGELWRTLVESDQDPAIAPSAEWVMQKLLTIGSNNIPCLMLLASAAEKRSDARAAADFYQRVLNRFPEFVPALKNLALLNVKELHNDKLASSLATKAREFLPNDPDLAFALGVIAYRANDFNTAARHLAEAARAPSPDATTLYYLGMAQYQLKQTKESKDSLQRALAGNLSADLASDARRVLAELK